MEPRGFGWGWIRLVAGWSIVLGQPVSAPLDAGDRTGWLGPAWLWGEANGFWGRQVARFGSMSSAGRS